jgi:hypothetical protein
MTLVQFNLNQAVDAKDFDVNAEWPETFRWMALPKKSR